MYNEIKYNYFCNIFNIQKHFKHNNIFLIINAKNVIFYNVIRKILRHDAQELCR